MAAITDHSRAAWLKGMGLVVIVALIWIAASYLVQAVEDDGLPPFILTYICNSLFFIYIPMVELAWCRKNGLSLTSLVDSVKAFLDPGMLKKLPGRLRDFFSKPGGGDTVPLVSRLSSEGDSGVFKGQGQYRYRMEVVPKQELVEDPQGHGIVVKRQEDSSSPTENSSKTRTVHQEDKSRSQHSSNSSTEKQSEIQEEPAAALGAGVSTGALDDSSPIKGVVECDASSSRSLESIDPERKQEEDSSPVEVQEGILTPGPRAIDSPDTVTRHPSFSYWVGSEGRQGQASGLHADQSGRLSHGGDSQSPRGHVKVIDMDSESLAEKSVVKEPSWTRARIAGVSLLICPFWFLAQLTFNVSLNYTTVSSNTILSSTASLFTFILSVAFLGERFTPTKLISILLVIAGTAVVSVADESTPTPGPDPSSNLQGTNTLVGDLLCLCSAFFYAVYTSLLMKCAPEEAAEEIHKEGSETEARREEVATVRGSSPGAPEAESGSRRQHRQSLAAIDEEGGIQGSPKADPYSEVEASNLVAGIPGRNSAHSSGSRERSESVDSGGDEPDSLPLMQGQTHPHLHEPLHSGKRACEDAPRVPEGDNAGGSKKQGMRVCIPGCCSSPVPYSTALMFGYLGCFNALLMLPLLFLLPVQRSWPTLTQWGLVIIKGLFDNVLSDYLWALAVLLTTPTAATLGLQIQIPISLVVDSFLEHSLPDLMHVGGAGLVLLGFLGINSFVDFDWLCDCSGPLSRPGHSVNEQDVEER